MVWDTLDFQLMNGTDEDGSYSDEDRKLHKKMVSIQLSFEDLLFFR